MKATTTSTLGYDTTVMGVSFTALWQMPDLAQSMGRNGVADSASCEIILLT